MLRSGRKIPTAMPSDPKYPDSDKLAEESRESFEKVRRLILSEGEPSNDDEPPLIKQENSD
jgi:hypothetical protein